MWFGPFILSQIDVGWGESSWCCCSCPNCQYLTGSHFTPPACHIKLPLHCCDSNSPLTMVECTYCLGPRTITSACANYSLAQRTFKMQAQWECKLTPSQPLIVWFTALSDALLCEAQKNNNKDP